MRKMVAIGAVALLMLAVAVPFAAAGTSTAPKTVAGNILVTPTGGDGSLAVFRFEVRTDASGAVQFGYYQADPVGAGWADLRSVSTVDSVRFYRDETGAKAAQFGGQECNITSGQCHDYALIVTDGTPDTFCGGPPDNPCQFKFDVLDGNIAIPTTGGQNGQ